MGINTRKLYYHHYNLFSFPQQIDSLRRQFQNTFRRAGLPNELKALIERGDDRNDVFVQRGFIDRTNNLPSFVLYKRETLLDMVSLMNDSYDDPCMFHVDKTFDINCQHLTMVTYKNQKLRNRTDGKPHLFLGPMLLHRDSNITVYRAFFETLKNSLEAVAQEEGIRFHTDEEFVFVSDQEKAITSAIDEVFPSCTRFLCSRHLEQNYIRRVPNKPSDSNTPSLQSMLKGLMWSRSQASFDKRRRALITSPEFLTFQNRQYILRAMTCILKFVCKPKWKLGLKKHITNNLSESANYKVKSYFGWKQLRPLELVQNLFEMCDIQFVEMKRALINLGSFTLTKSFDVQQIPSSIDNSYQQLLRGNFSTTSNPQPCKIPARRNRISTRIPTIKVNNLGVFAVSKKGYMFNFLKLFSKAMKRGKKRKRSRTASISKRRKTQSRQL